MNLLHCHTVTLQIATLPYSDLTVILSHCHTPNCHTNPNPNPNPDPNNWPLTKWVNVIVAPESNPSSAFGLVGITFSHPCKVWRGRRPRRTLHGYGVPLGLRSRSITQEGFLRGVTVPTLQQYCHTCDSVTVWQTRCKVEKGRGHFWIWHFGDIFGFDTFECDSVAVWQNFLKNYWKGLPKSISVISVLLFFISFALAFHA